MNYVMTDIHGNLRRYQSVMAQIGLKAEDTLYVLGDVIDRHPDGIKILRMIMEMPNAKMLLGNHELMMLDALKAQEGTYKDSFWQQEQLLQIWYQNGGEVTHRYIKRIRRAARAEILDYLEHLPLNLEVTVQNQSYRLVHGSPLELYEKYSSKYANQREFAVWQRCEADLKWPQSQILIFGHTPTMFYQDKNPLEIWRCRNLIGLDCGSGFAERPTLHNPKQGRLACLRLEDGKVFYSQEMQAE